MVTLYHGTSTAKWEGIQCQGLVNPFLTSSLTLAEYYAEVACDEVAGEHLILSVEVKEDELRYDGNAMGEPVGFDNFSISDLEELVLLSFSKLAKEYPEWCRGDMIIIPKTEYRISLEVVASCWCEAIVPLKRIKETE